MVLYPKGRPISVCTEYAAAVISIINTAFLDGLCQAQKDIEKYFRERSISTMDLVKTLGELHHREVERQQRDPRTAGETLANHYLNHEAYTARDLHTMAEAISRYADTPALWHLQ